MRQQEKVAAMVLGAAVIVLAVAIIFGLKGGEKSKHAGGDKIKLSNTEKIPGGVFNAPRGIAVDKKGDVYVLDAGNHRVQKFDSKGEFVKAWGKEGDGEGQLKTPGGLDVGPEGNIYVADTWNHRIQVFDNAGKFLKSWLGNEGFWGPRDVAVGQDGMVYVTDTGNRKIQKFDDQGEFIVKWGQQGSGPDEYDEPFGIKVDDKGLLYICDRLNFRIKVIDSEGKTVRMWPIDGWQKEQFYMEPYLAIDNKRDTVFVTDPTKHRIHKFDRQGKSKGMIEKTPEGLPLGTPVGVAVNENDGILYVTDMTANKLYRYDLKEGN